MDRLDIFTIVNSIYDHTTLLCCRRSKKCCFSPVNLEENLNFLQLCSRKHLIHVSFRVHNIPKTIEKRKIAFKCSLAFIKEVIKKDHIKFKMLENEIRNRQEQFYKILDENHF